MSVLVFLPFLVSLLLSGLFFRAFGKNFTQILTISSVFLSFIGSVFSFVQVFNSGIPIEFTILEWINFGSFTVNWGFFADQITCIMLIVVTGVSLLVHIYSTSYMSHDENPQRFMVFLNLFTFFMLVLVTADNFLQLFVGWEGVGLSSYLLIGFWFKKDSANNAAIKAFVANRVGDLALILGIAAIYFHFGTLKFSEVFAKVPEFSDFYISFLGIKVHLITFICTALFIGCMGKSAQLGLHVWLPDAMEGPTPVSALIHAATMVTAGVFLVVRCSWLFEYAPFTRELIIAVGSLTAIFAASIALTQTDIKKIIAYSTCSQLGYMFFAAGSSAYEAALFHLATHAFFKALLFLSAGSVIHALDGEQDINKMGGLAKKIPFTYACFLIGSLAIAGVFPFAGFYSKDAILESVFVHNTLFGKMAFSLGIAAACMTSFYSWRLIILVFNGTSRCEYKTYEHAHESPFPMALPLAVLLLMSVLGGFLGYYGLHILSHYGFLSSVIFHSDDILEEMHHVSIFIKYLPLVLSCFFIGLAYFLYLKKPAYLGLIQRKFSFFHKLSANKYYVDEIYDLVFVRPLFLLSKLLGSWFDKKVIDKFIPHSGVLFGKFGGNAVNFVQSGFLQNYILTSAIFVVVIIYMLVFLYV